tara:strand:- start:74 stop:352 length:279 start_codon:yes stop_codon:yes gene_type:complete
MNDSNWDELFPVNFNTEEASSYLFKIEHLIDNCLGDFSVQELEDVRSRHDLLIEQKSFWVDQNNYFRYIYDLNDHFHWLVEYIVFVSESKKS